MMTGDPHDTADAITLRHTDAGIGAADFEHKAWREAVSVSLDHYWSGEPAPPGRRAEARLLWTPKGLCVRFRCEQAEPLVVSAAPRVAQKTLGLWERDVCEIFVAPDVGRPEHYFEFEVAPTGEWVDLEIEARAEGRVTNRGYRSGMEAAGRIADGEVLMALRVPWRAFGRDAPQAGEVWRANLFRCVGRDAEDLPRGYLAWRPTYTPQPSFHVPAQFGRLVFTA